MFEVARRPRAAPGGYLGDELERPRAREINRSILLICDEIDEPAGRRRPEISTIKVQTLKLERTWLYPSLHHIRTAGPGLISFPGGRRREDQKIRGGRGQARYASRISPANIVSRGTQRNKSERS